jgi:hypothetical protein
MPHSVLLKLAKLSVSVRVEGVSDKRGWDDERRQMAIVEETARKRDTETTQAYLYLELFQALFAASNALFCFHRVFILSLTCRSHSRYLTWPPEREAANLTRPNFLLILDPTKFTAYISRAVVSGFRLPEPYVGHNSSHSYSSMLPESSVWPVLLFSPTRT